MSFCAGKTQGEKMQDTSWAETPEMGISHRGMEKQFPIDRFMTCAKHHTH